MPKAHSWGLVAFAKGVLFLIESSMGFDPENVVAFTLLEQPAISNLASSSNAP
ncbi:MAG: hypothetical protein R3F17_09040 [Planctomycetota bacterium]